MATTAIPDSNLPTSGSEHVSLLPLAGAVKASPDTAQAYQSLVALARLMGRKAAVAAIHAGATPASPTKRKISP
jgi:hypothetical protein